MFSKTLVALGLIGLFLAATCAQADDLSDLEKLQRQIDAAKAAKQSKPAAAPAPKRKTTPAQAQAEATPSKSSQGSMTEAGAGILRQNSTGLLWTQRDNGADIDWNEATRYCSAKGDWRLPTREELKSLLGGSETTPCGEYSCRVSSKFWLTNVWFWTNEMGGSSGAWYVYLYDGPRTPTLWPTAATYERCVCGVPEHGAG